MFGGGIDAVQNWAVGKKDSWFDSDQTLARGTNGNHVDSLLRGNDFLRGLYVQKKAVGYATASTASR